MENEGWWSHSDPECLKLIYLKHSTVAGVRDLTARWRGYVYLFSLEICLCHMYFSNITAMRPTYVGTEYAFGYLICVR